MKTLIVGTGVIGVIYGWALAQAGVDVTHFVRPGRKDRFANGLTLDLLDERKGHPKFNLSKYALKCVEQVSPADGYELILVPVNLHQAEAALQSLAPQTGPAIFLTLAGNWDGAQFIDHYLPRERCLMGYADGGGTIREDGVYWTNLGAELHIGVLDKSARPALEKARALFARADIKLDEQENIIHWLWQHAAGAVGYAAGFAKHRDLKRFLADKDLLRQSTLATKEMFKLCERRGVDLGKYPEAGFVNLPVWLVSILVRWNIQHQESAQRYTAHVVSEGSRQETRAYLERMLKTAHELGFDMPYTQELGKYLS